MLFYTGMIILLYHCSHLSYTLCHYMYMKPLNICILYIYILLQPNLLYTCSTVRSHYDSERLVHSLLQWSLQQVQPESPQAWGCPANFSAHVKEVPFWEKKTEGWLVVERNKHMSSSVGMMKFPMEKQEMFKTTNQRSSLPNRPMFEKITRGYDSGFTCACCITVDFNKP